MASVAAPVDPDIVSDPLDPSGHEGRRPSRRGLMAAAAATLVLLGAGVFAAWLVGHRTASSAAGGPVITRSSQNVKVATGTMTQSVSASGTLEPADDADLTFGASGTVTEVDVKVGEHVTRGQVLAKIGRAALAFQVAAGKAALASDRDQLATDEDDGALSATIDAEKAQITTAKTQLASARSSLAAATLRATFSGTVAAVDLAVGDVVSASSTGSASAGAATGTGSTSAGSSSIASSSSSGSSSAITVISTHAYTISTSVDDTEIGEVKVGDRVTITPSGSSTALTGKVTSVSLIASTSSDSSVASFPVQVAVTGRPKGMYAGTSATLAIIVKQLKDVVEVPTAAISYSSGQAAVTVVSGGSHRTVDVQTGASLNGETQITRGVKAGDTVVEEVTRFKAPGGASRSLFGGSGPARGRPGGFSGGAGGFNGTPPEGSPPAGFTPGAGQSGGQSGAAALFGSGGSGN